MSTVRIYHNNEDITDHIINGGWETTPKKDSFEEIDNEGCAFMILKENDKFAKVFNRIEVFIDGELKYQSKDINPFFNSMRMYG